MNIHELVYFIHIIVDIQIIFHYGIFRNTIKLFRLRHAQGVEKLRAEGGVSFIYDEPHKFERYHDQRERVIPIKRFTNISY